MASGRALQQLLYDVRPGDPQVLGIVAIVMMLVGVLAGWLPARRAASLDPVLALKED